ncbi:MAG: hypothetical protein J0L75_11800 [Spirochaetes bacterium]|nr:hypothetical protein [Spirochaetota bacterium]
MKKSGMRDQAPLLLSALVLGILLGTAVAKAPKSTSNPASDENTPPPPPANEQPASEKKSKGAGKSAKDSKDGEAAKKKEDAEALTLEGKIAELNGKELTLKISSRTLVVSGTCAISKGEVKDEAKFVDLKVGDRVTVTYAPLDGKDVATKIVVKAGKPGESAEAPKDESSASKEKKKKKSKPAEAGSDH